MKIITNINIIVLLSILVLVETMYLIDLQTKSDNAIAELMILKSEEQMLDDTNYLDRNETLPIIQKVIKKQDYPQNNFLKITPILNNVNLLKKYVIKKKYDVKTVSIKVKKTLFIGSVLPAILQSRNKLLTTYKSVEELKVADLTIQDEEYLNILFKAYKVKKGNIQKLLLAIKPHSVSVIMAQAVLESGWGTSRFYKEANNIFGIWSFNEDDERIKARRDKKVYLRKYDSLVEAVDDYMLMLGRNPRYEDFRKTRFRTNNPYEIIKHLEIYSELRKEYVRRLNSVIRANRFTKYDNQKMEAIDLAE